MPAWLQYEWCLSFVLALGHFLWQGTLIAVVLAVALRATKKVSVRYWLSLSALLLMATCPVVTLGWLLQPVSSGSGLQDSQLADQEFSPLQEPAPPILNYEDLTPASRHMEHVSNVPIPPPITPNAAQPPITPADERSWWQKCAPQLTTAYLCGATLMLLRLVIGLWGGRRLRRRVHLIDDSSLLNAMQRQATALGLKLLPVLAYCERVTVPTVIGVLKPMILLPLTLTSGLSPEQIESVLAHELAHLRRRDHLVNLLQRVIESLLFFHPAVWWVSHRIREEREHCCDDLVVACGAMPLDYAKSLLVVAELSRASKLRRSVAAVSLLATGGKPSNLRQRIARLLGESETPSLRISPRVLMVSITVLLVGLASLIPLGISDDQTTQAKDDEVVAKGPPLEFRFAVANADRDQDGTAWFPIIKPRVPAPAGKSGIDVPIEEKLDEEWRGLLWDKAEHSLLADGTWKVLKCVVVKAEHSTDITPRFDIQIKLDAAGGALMRRLTAAHLNQKLAIVVDGAITAVPTLRSEIGESCVITGDFSKAIAEQLAAAIRKPDRRKKATPTNFTAQLPDGIEIELLGVATGEKDSAWWKPDGTQLDQSPLTHGSKANGLEPQQEGRCFAARVRGGQPREEVAMFVDGVLSGSSSRNAIQGSQELTKTVGPIGKLDATTVRVAFGLAEFGPPQGISPKGDKLASVLPDDLKPWYDVISPLGVEEANGQAALRLSPLNVVTIRHIVQWSVTDIDGKQHAVKSGEYSNSRTELLKVKFDLPLSRIARFEYQLRPYRHWVTFENVSLHPGQKTEVKVTTAPPPLPRPDKYIAQLPDALNVEFVGITRNTAPAKDGWRPDGLPIGDVGYWPAKIYRSGNTTGRFDENGEHPEPNAGALDLLFRFRGLKAQPSLAFDLAANGVGYSHDRVKDPYELRITTERRSPLPGGKWTIPDGEMRVGLTDEPWGRFVKISPDGKVLDPIQPDERHASTYKLIEVLGTKPHERAPTGKTVVLHMPLTVANSPTNDEGSPDLRHRFAFEFRAIDTEGKSHWADAWQSGQVPDTKLNESQYGLMQPLPAGATLSHYEYRLRPYRHWVTFENVSLQPSKPTQVKVKVESLPDEKSRAERGALDPDLDPTAGLPNSNGDTKTTNNANGDPHRAQATAITPSAEAKSDAEQQPGRAAEVTEAELLRMLVRGGKIDTKSINTAITRVAARGAQDVEFARLVLAEFEKSCEGGDRTSQGRRYLLAVLSDILEAWSSPGWRSQLGRLKPDALPQTKPPQTEPPPVDSKLEREMLDRVIQHGYATDRSEIANVSLAVRQLHHPAGREFLRDVLRNAESGSDSFEPSTPSKPIPPQTVPQQRPQVRPATKTDPETPPVSRWKDNTGGGWGDAKFVAAVGLAELGESEGVDWLLARAQPNDFGIDGSLWTFPHIKESRGSLRESSRLALADLFGLSGEVTVTGLGDWWRNNRAKFIARPVMLKPRAGREAPAALAPAARLPNSDDSTKTRSDAKEGRRSDNDEAGWEDPHRAQSPKFSARLPNGVEVELAGIAMANVSYPDLSKRRKADAWWRADGTRLQAPPMKLFSSWVDESQKDFREFAIKLTPARGATSITANYVTWTPTPARGSSGSAGWDTSAGEPGILKLQHTAGFKKGKPVAVHVIVSDQPLGPAWLIDVNGQPLPQKPADTKTAALRQLVQIVGVEKSGNETIFRRKHLAAELDESLEINLRAIDQRDQPHESGESRGSAAGAGRVFKLPAADIKHFEIRLRPMTQKVTFENVSLVPGEKTDVKVKVEPVDALARAERGSPDPALDPTAGLLNSDDTAKTTNETNGDLRSDPAAESNDTRRTKAIEQGIAFLKAGQQVGGAWEGTPVDGVTALAAVALLQAGVTSDDPALLKAFAHLRKVEPTHSYTVALQTIVFCAASPKEDAELIRRNVAWLEKAQVKEGKSRGSWSYGVEPGGRGDGSCSRFALLGLDAASKAGFEVQEETWRRVSDYWLANQKENGGWGYTPESGTTLTMTLSGIAGLATANRHLPRDEQSKTREAAIRKPEKFIEKALADLPRAAFVLYALHSLERAGNLSDIARFGELDWKAVTTKLLLETQNRNDGHWKASNESDVIATSFALLALSGQPEPKTDTRARRGKPALDPTAGLPNSDEGTNPPKIANGDLRSNPAAGSGDPRRAQDSSVTDETDRGLQREDQTPPLSKFEELELFASRLRSIAPRDWVVERKDRAFRLRGPDVPAGKERAQILLWFDDVWVGSSDALAKRDQSLPKIGHMSNTRIGRHYLTRNTAAEELWPEFGLKVRLIEPVDQIAIATADVLQSEIVSQNWFDAALVRYIEIGPDGRRQSQLVNLNGSPIGITAVTKFMVVGKLPNPKTATNEADRGSALRHLKTFDGLKAEAKRHGIRTISLADFERYTERAVKEGRGFRARRIDDANKLQIPECLTTGQGLVIVRHSESQTKVDTAPPVGLEFLKPYPKLHGLSLDMTEPQFLEIVKQEELQTRKTVEGEKVTHHISLGDDHTLIVMFDKDAKCSGIQRVRGEDDVPARPKAVLGRESFKGRVMIDGAIPRVPPTKVQPGLMLINPRNDEDERRNEKAQRDTPVVEIADDSLVISKEGGLANVAIYLKKAPANWQPSAPPETPVELRSGDYRFQPRLSFLRVGQPLRLIAPKNEADNFLVTPIRSNTFNLLVPHDSQRDVPQPFTRSEPVPIDVKSNLHPWQKAFLLAVDHPFAAITDADGRFEIRDLPAGEHHFTVWHERRGYLNKDLVVRVEDGKVTAVDLKYTIEQLSPGAVAPPIQKPDAKPNARAGRGSPDPALEPTAGLPDSDKEKKTPNNAKGDLQSNTAPGSGDPRRAHDHRRLTLMFFQRHLAPLGQPLPPWTWTEIEPAEPSVSATFLAS